MTCRLNVAPAYPNDCIGTAQDNVPSGNDTLYLIFGSFTGFHRSFTEDDLFNTDEPQ
jgi:hypothetical protein